MDAVRLETEDLILEKARQEDWKDMYENLWRHSESAKHMLWTVSPSEEEARARMARTIALEREKPYALLVYEKRSGKAIGFAGMEEIMPGVFEETGIALGPAFVGKGYGKQILRALIAEAFDRRGAKQMIACCRSENEASRRMQMACGFRYDHTEERVDPRDGKPYLMEYNLYER